MNTLLIVLGAAVMFIVHVSGAGHTKSTSSTRDYWTPRHIERDPTRSDAVMHTITESVLSRARHLNHMDSSSENPGTLFKPEELKQLRARQGQ